MTITDLTNTRWKCNDTITTYLSTWYNVNVVCSTTAPDGTALTVTGVIGGNAGTRMAVSSTVWGRPMLYWNTNYRYNLDLQGTLEYYNLPPFELFFNDGADNGNTNLINWIQNNATLQGPITHNINYNLNNCTGVSSNPTTINEGESITLSFTTNTGYSFPTDIRVLGVTSYNWNPNTGNLILNNATGDVTIVINCSLSIFSITTNLFNCTSDSTNPNTIEYGASVSLQFTPNQTYMFTDTISVTNATYTWNKDTGILNISNPTDNVVITLSAIDDGKLYLYLYQNIAEGNRVDKTNYLTSVGLISGTFRDSTSINDLVITYQSELLPNFNYVYIPKLNRYYFVDDITSENYSLWTLALSVDPLMTYKEAILNCNGFVDRSESDFNANIIDKKRVIEEGNTIEVDTVTNELFTNTSGTYIMTALLVGFDSTEA